jgi:hypothetical protein
MARTSFVRLSGCALTAAVVIGICTTATASADPEVALRFDIGTNGEQIATVANSGTAATRQRIVVAGGGYLVGRWSRTGRLAADYPAFNGSRSAPRAVVAVSNAGLDDELDPGAARFMFGADVRRDAVSKGTWADNGNNVIQRGLFTDAAQYKIQIDDGHASCRVKGNRGVLRVESTVVMGAHTWYRLTCARRIWARGEHLELTVAPINADGTPGTAVTSSSAVHPVGTTSFSRATPLSVGGKLIPGPAIDPASDQFNGWIDNAFFRDF